MKGNKITIILLIIAILVIAGVAGLYFFWPKNVALAELEKYDIEVSGDASKRDTTIPQDLTGFWSYVKNICEDGGYDLSTYTEKEVTMTTYPINQYYHKKVYNDTEPLQATVITKGNKVICAYKSTREGSMLLPGFFAIDDMNLIE